jgi:uncharacterized membrane protein
MAPLANYETIPPEERLRRIGRLLCKAAILALARREAEETGKQTPAIPTSYPSAETGTGANEGLNPEEQELLHRAWRLGGISPREASRLWKVSRATTYRRLSSLEKQGWIVRKGATTATRYVLTRQALDWLG